MLSERNFERLESFKAILGWMEHELSAKASYRKLPIDLRLIDLWLQSSAIHSIFVHARVPDEWMSEKFHPRGVTLHSFTREPVYWHDVLCPRKLSTVPFALASAVYALGSDCGPNLRNTLKARAQQLLTSEDSAQQTTFSSVLESRHLSGNVLGSFLSADIQSVCFEPLEKGSSTDLDIQPSQLLTEQCIKTLEQKPADLNSWALLHATLADHVPDARCIGPLTNLLLSLDIQQIYREDKLSGEFALLMITQQCQNIHNQLLVEHAENATIEVARYLNFASKGAQMEQDMSQMSLIESALNLANSKPGVPTAEAFAGLFQRMANHHRPLYSAAHQVFSRLVEELPPHQACFIWPLELHARMR